jgi:hypothetical protein
MYVSYLGKKDNLSGKIFHTHVKTLAPLLVLAPCNKQLIHYDYLQIK